MLQRRGHSPTLKMPSGDMAYLLLCVLATFPVAAIAQTPSARSPSNPEVIVTEKDNGGKVTIAKGGSVIVRLEVTSGTGYSWALAKNGAPQLKAQGKSSLEKPRNAMPGATEIQVFRFKAASTGFATLEIHYARPWEKDTPPAKTFQVQVTVQ